jgi:hypothetical protein
MKTKLILAAAVATLTFTSGVYAGDAVLSPRAKEMQDSLRKVPGTTMDMTDRSAKVGSPKAQDLAHSLRKIPSTGPGIDLAHGPRPTLSPKDSRYETALRELRQSQFQVAPLK